MYLKDRFGVSASHAGDLVALCTAIGALGRPIGGAISDRIGGIRSLYIYYSVACAAMLLGGATGSLALNIVAFCVACGAFGMGNGAVFQLLPQRFRAELNDRIGWMRRRFGRISFGQSDGPEPAFHRRIHVRADRVRRLVPARAYGPQHGENAMENNLGRARRRADLILAP